MKRLGVTIAIVLWSSAGWTQPAPTSADKHNEEGTEEPAPVQEIAPDEAAPRAETKPEAAPAQPTKPAHVDTMDELSVPTSFLRFGINFFGDASFILTSPTEPHSTFAIGTLGLRMLGQLSPTIDALAELAFETTSAGPLADVEQLAVRWRSGFGVLEVGRFHTNIGYWNRAYHHGLWLQTPVERPHALRFEDDGGLVPVHWVGGAYTLGESDAPFAAVIAVGNGRGNIVDDVRVASDTNEAKAVLLKGRYKAGSLEAGVGFIYDLIAPADIMVRPALPNQRIHELIANAYVVLRGEGPIVIAEGYAFRHQTSAKNWMTYSAYAVVGYRVTDLVTPYAAIDVVSGANDDPFFTPDPTTPTARDLVEPLAGVRIDVSTWSALKIEARFNHPLDAGDNEYVGVVSWSFGL